MLARTQPSLLARVPRSCFHVTFEERRWVIGDGLTSLEGPSGHLPSCPARGTCAARSKHRALGAANYPAADARPRDPACPEDGAREEPVDVAQTGKQSSSRYSSSPLPASRRARWGPTAAPVPNHSPALEISLGEPL